MAGNTNSGFRKGDVKERTQVYNPATGMFMKRDTTTGRFMAGSANKFKGVTDEQKQQPKAKLTK